jgi:predicted  nucleic acid-binding Zn-ribbon protein
MLVSSISSTGNYYNNNEYEITRLEKQKAAYQKELQKINQSSEDAKTKKQKIEKIQMQIQKIENQIQKLKSKKTNSKQAAVQGNQSTSENIFDVRI